MMDIFGIDKKKVIIVSGRVHPGETPASWMMEGFIRRLLSDHPSIHALRSSFIFYVVPVINIDGVMFGNNRCSLAGVDLNRQWMHPSSIEHPPIAHLKNLIASVQQSRNCWLYLDLHGHSRRMNIFLYGLEDKKVPGSKHLVRSYPKLLSTLSSSSPYFSFGDCSFNAKKGREGTARVVVSKELGIQKSFTVEATFCGSSVGPLRDCHFSTDHYLEAGAGLCDSMVELAIQMGVIQEKKMSSKSSSSSSSSSQRGGFLSNYLASSISPSSLEQLEETKKKKRKEEEPSPSQLFSNQRLGQGRTILHQHDAVSLSSSRSRVGEVHEGDSVVGVNRFSTTAPTQASFSPLRLSQTSLKGKETFPHPPSNPPRSIRRNRTKNKAIKQPAKVKRKRKT